jgi:hypothetical protein
VHAAKGKSEMEGVKILIPAPPKKAEWNLRKYMEKLKEKLLLLFFGRFFRNIFIDSIAEQVLLRTD